MLALKGGASGASMACAAPANSGSIKSQSNATPAASKAYAAYVFMLLLRRDASLAVLVTIGMHLVVRRRLSSSVLYTVLLQPCAPLFYQGKERLQTPAEARRSQHSSVSSLRSH